MTGEVCITRRRPHTRGWIECPAWPCWIPSLSRTRPPRCHQHSLQEYFSAGLYWLDSDLNGSISRPCSTLLSLNTTPPCRDTFHHLSRTQQTSWSLKEKSEIFYLCARCMRCSSIWRITTKHLLIILSSSTVSTPSQTRARLSQGWGSVLRYSIILFERESSKKIDPHFVWLPWNWAKYQTIGSNLTAVLRHALMSTWISGWRNNRQVWLFSVLNLTWF